MISLKEGQILKFLWWHLLFWCFLFKINLYNF